VNSVDLTPITDYDTDYRLFVAVGASWEGFVIEQILRLIPSSWQYYFFRTNAGAEIDLLLLDKKIA